MIFLQIITLKLNNFRKITPKFRFWVNLEAFKGLDLEKSKTVDFQAFSSLQNGWNLTYIQKNLSNLLSTNSKFYVDYEKKHFGRFWKTWVFPNVRLVAHSAVATDYKNSIAHVSITLLFKESKMESTSLSKLYHYIYLVFYNSSET